MEISTRFCALLGFQMMPGKSVAGPPATFLGLIGYCPPASSGFQMSISHPQEKRQRSPHLLEGFLKGANIAHSCMGSLVGKLSFSRTFLFVMCARTKLRPLYQKHNQMLYSSRLSAYERSVFTWWDRAD